MSDSVNIVIPSVISVDPDLCVNCHACIAVCPVKFCNDGSKDYVTVNPEMCIGCGRCLAACTHDARKLLDDLDPFLDALKRRDPLVVLVAPSVAAGFPDQWMQLNGWLRSVGVSAVFDVSFGAELTIQNYAAHIRESKPACLIASPCPAVVSYIALYRPELLPYLAPYDSPILHTLKMIQALYPQYDQHRRVVISPCLAKKRELAQRGAGDLNLTMLSLDGYLKEQGIDLRSFEASDFDEPSAQNGVLFSSPGGLVRNMECQIPGITQQTRKIEGAALYSYLDQLPEAIEQGRAPLLVDCLGCEKGCNGGPGSVEESVPVDQLDYLIKQRHAARKDQLDPESLRRQLDPFLKAADYHRVIPTLSGLNRMKEPSEEEFAQVFRSMLKTRPEDILNCTACGYSTCREMARAIYNGLNRPENCHKYLQQAMKLEHARSIETYRVFRDMFQLSHDAVLIEDAGRFIDCNPAACDLFGFERDEIINSGSELIFGCPLSPGKNFRQSVEENGDVLKAGGVVKYECVLDRSDGSTFDSDIRMSNLQLEGRSVLQVRVKDVTLTKRARQTLEDGHAYIKALFESVEVGILVIACDNRQIIDVNSYALRLINASRDEVLGRECHCFVCPAQVDNCPVMDLGQRVETSERVLLDASGREVPILKTAITVRLNGRDCLVESFVDLSKKKETERALKDARDEAERANRAKSDFLANMSHEIRTPMNGVLGMADLLLDMNLSDEQHQLAQDILLSANNLLTVINDILDFSKIESNELVLEAVPFRVADTVAQALRVLEPLATQRGNELRVRYESELPCCLLGDSTRFRQVLLNLLGNAVKFTNKGRVELVLSGEKNPSTALYRLDVAVRDNGIGIAPEKQAVIFDKFSQADSSTTRKYGGTGLGLAITQELVGLMGGDIFVSSKLGQGTEFTFFIELEMSDHEICPVPEVTELKDCDKDFHNLSVLLVEDNRVNRIVIGKALERFGCTVSMAENGQLALDCLQEHSYDIVFMDCSMPVMDGFEATRQIREQLKLDALPVIAITAHAMQGDDQRCYDAGMNGYVMKPVDRAHLQKVLNDFC